MSTPWLWGSPQLCANSTITPPPSSSLEMGVLPSSVVTATFPAFTASSTSVSGRPITSPVVQISPQTQSDSSNPIPASLQALALPAKLITKILELQYVDMAELIPESWRHQDEEHGGCCHRRPQRKGPVTDILLWVECFSSMATILSSKYPEKTPQLMSYLKTIVKAHRSFKGEGWVSYDTDYRRKAALKKSLDWGEVDFTMYNEMFTGRARPPRKCTHCNSEHHTEESCPRRPPPESRFYKDGSYNRTPRQFSSALCQLYNTRAGNRCTFNPCKFNHKCMECRGNHPLANCDRGRPPAPRAPRHDNTK